MRALRVVISGRVQGVGFRYWTEQAAQRYGLDGWVRNLHDGRVEAVFAGDPERVEAMLAACKKGPRFAQVTEVAEHEHRDPVPVGFHVRRSV